MQNTNKNLFVGRSLECLSCDVTLSYKSTPTWIWREFITNFTERLMRGRNSRTWRDILLLRLPSICARRPELEISFFIFLQSAENNKYILFIYFQPGLLCSLKGVFFYTILSLGNVGSSKERFHFESPTKKYEVGWISFAGSWDGKWSILMEHVRKMDAFQEILTTKQECPSNSRAFCSLGYFIANICGAHSLAWSVVPILFDL